MSSKALLLPSTAPKLRAHFSHGIRSIEVWTTTCIVTRFGRTSPNTNCSVLINPSNPELVGCKNFPYFPRGGPVPAPVKSMHKDWQPLGFVSQWGGMEIGSGMLFPASVVDGLVHQLGGWTLQAELQMKRVLRKHPCPVGTACVSSAGKGELSTHFDAIVHTTPPFYAHHDEPVIMLRRCYDAAIQLAFEKLDGEGKVATPLLGAGARGFPAHVAMEVASGAAVGWLHGWDVGSVAGPGGRILCFGILEERHANDLSEMIRNQLDRL